MTGACDLDRAGLVEAEIDRVATQYRESTKLLATVRAYLGQVADVVLAACPIPEAFDLDTAVGDQLTIVGKWLGWPRTHCRGARQAVFGFSVEGCNPCDPSTYAIGGFCTSDWAGCPSSDFAPYTFVDDELYRRFLRARVVQLKKDFRRSTLVEAMRDLFDEPDAIILKERAGEVSISLARPLDPGEWQILGLYRDVLPIPPGVGVAFYTQYDEGAPFGFGTGWGEFCDPWAISVDGATPGVIFPEAPILDDGDGTVDVAFASGAIAGTGFPGATVVIDFGA